MFLPGQQYQIKTLKCPFDPAHFMPKSSFIRHIQRCRAGNKHNFRQCPYDVYHIVKKTQYDIHCKICKSNRPKDATEIYWGECEDIEQNEYDQNQEEDQVQFNKKNILTQSIVQHAYKQDKSHESSLIKAIEQLKLNKQQQEDCEYWIDPKQLIVNKSIQSKQNPSIQSKQINSIQNTQLKPIQQNKLQKPQLLAKQNINHINSSKLTQSCVAPSKHKLLNPSIHINPNSQSFHPHMNIKPLQKHNISNLYSDTSQLSKSGYIYPRQYPTGYYGQGYYPSSSQYGYPVYPYSGYHAPYPVPPPNDQYMGHQANNYKNINPHLQNQTLKLSNDTKQKQKPEKLKIKLNEEKQHVKSAKNKQKKKYNKIINE